MKQYFKGALLALTVAAIGIAFAGRDGTGTYSLPAGNPVSTGTAISTTWANTTLSDIATALSNSIAKDGQTVATANLPMGTFRHTNVGNASARSHYAAAGQVQDFSLQKLGSVSGTDTIAASLTPAITAYSAGMIVTLTPANSNTAAATLAVNGLAALDVQKADGDALVAADLVAGIPAVLVLDTGADDWILLNPQSATLANGVALSDLPRLSQANTFTASQTISAATPVILLDETGASANERFWRTISTSGQWVLQTRTDVGGAGSNAILIDRTGTTVDSINLAATAVQANGNAIRHAGNTDTSSSGTYTPTLTSGGNVQASTSAVCQWLRVGNVVTVSGAIQIDPTAAAQTQLLLTLPVASALANNADLGGAGAHGQASLHAASAVPIYADVAGDRAFMDWVSPGTANEILTFSFTYIVK